MTPQDHQKAQLRGLKWDPPKVTCFVYVPLSVS